MIEELKPWLKPRTVFAALFYGAFVYLVITGKIKADALLAIISILMGHFFGVNKSKETRNNEVK